MSYINNQEPTAVSRNIKMRLSEKRTDITKNLMKRSPMEFHA